MSATKSILSRYDESMLILMINDRERETEHSLTMVTSAAQVF